ncbi:MAG: hypothetical protein COB67_08290 [SAR324 cluster bacterium]|uniref:Uncharacterized protein n=1 Tax=SAR324 cluster bacterium TaxID=2024889 RepID=A0A2A4T2H9_9DELT|nr:MAG: hypothetical protein COB67_08290 [SAR324 cluster bacterium]
MNFKKLLFTLVKFSFTGGIIYYMAESGRLDFQRLTYLWQSPAVLFEMLAILVMLILPLSAIRWWVLLRGISVHVPLMRTGILTWIGNFFNSTLPGAVSGDVVKGYYIVNGEQEHSKSKIVVSLLIDRFTGLFGLIIISFGAILLQYDWVLEHPKLYPLVGMILVLFCGTLFFYAIVFIPFKEDRDPIVRLLKKLPFSQALLKLYRNFKGYQKKWKSLLGCLVLAIITHGLFAYLFILVSQLLGVQDLDLILQLIVMPLGMISIAIPIQFKSCSTAIVNPNMIGGISPVSSATGFRSLFCQPYATRCICRAYSFLVAF